MGCVSGSCGLALPSNSSALFLTILSNHFFKLMVIFKQFKWIKLQPP